MRRERRRSYLIAYLLLLPAVALLALFTFYPVAYSAYLGFSEYTSATFAKGLPPRFVGLANFAKVFGDPVFRTGLANSVRYLLVVPALQLASLSIAVVVNRKIPGIALFRAAYDIPVITSVSLAGVMWDWVYQKDGILNWVLEALHVVGRQQAFGWLNNTDTALWAVMFVTFWRGFGYYMVLYLAGLQSIPTELEEAATLDGANRWNTFWRVIVPLMRPTILLCSLLSTLAAIRALEEILVLTGGGPLNSTYTALMYVYNKAFQGFRFDYGVASAAGLVIALVGFVLSYLNFRFIREDAGVQA